MRGGMVALGQHRGDRAPEHPRQRGSDVNRGQPQPDVAPGAIDPGHLGVGARHQAVQVLGQVRRGLQGAGLAARPVGVGRAGVVGEERALRAAAPQGVGDPAGELAGAGQELGQLAVLGLRPTDLVEHPRPDAVAQQRPHLLARRGQGVEQVRVAPLDE